MNRKAEVEYYVEDEAGPILEQGLFLKVWGISLADEL